MLKTGLNRLESEVMQMLLAGDHPTLVALRSQIQHLSVVKRERTGVGSFTTFIPDANALPVILPSERIVFGDVHANPTQGLELGGGFILFIENGMVTTLEGFSYGNDWPEDAAPLELFYRDPARSEVEATFG